MEKILLIEDSVEYREYVQRVLGKEFDLVSAASLAEATEEIKNNAFDLIILDAVLPDGDGFMFCSSLQENDSTRNFPVLFLTGRKQVTDVILGFSVGADDYMTKPVDPGELKARIRAKIRRKRQSTGDQDVLVKEDLRFSRSSGTVRCVLDEGKEVEIFLTPVEFKILFLLARSEGEAFSREKIIAAVWGQSVHIAARTVDVHVCNIRSKIGQSKTEIVPLRSFGYTFRSIRGV